MTNGTHAGLAVTALEKRVEVIEKMVSKSGCYHSTCKWSDNKDFDSPRWETTGCGQEFYVIEGGLKENDYNYCPSCGGKIEQ